MRSTFFPLAFGLLLGISSTAFARENLDIGNQTPQDYASIQGILDSQIPDYLSESQCGGWQNESVSGKIAQVAGVPGRTAVWNGNIPSGMGSKDTQFIYPDSARGLSTVCQEGLDHIQKAVWRDKPGGYPGEIEQVTQSFHYPKIVDPPCRWRAAGGQTAPNQLGSNPADFVPFDYNEIGDRQSPPVCGELCPYLNQFSYIECIAPYTETIFIPNGDEVETIEYTACAPNGWQPLFICSNAPVSGNEDACVVGENSTKQSNARGCGGQGCRNNPPYKSYYREYDGAYARQAVVNIAGLNDKNSNTGEVACYGFYSEFNPLTRRTESKDRRCVINIDVSTYKDSQEGKGEYGQNSNLPDRDPNAAANQRNNGQYDGGNDVWYQKLSGGFSLLNEKVFKENFDRDLSNVFLATDKLDSAAMHAAYQLEEARPLAVSNTVRGFDDTGSKRIVVGWWQKQETAMAAILHPSVIRILLPAGWMLGSNTTDPFFTTVARPPEDVFQKRNDRIELQIDADEDMLGSALGYIERSLLFKIEEEPIPVLLPLGSATEFRAKAEQWCQWYVREFSQPNCESAPIDVKVLIKRLEEYADTIDNARKLRGELARYAAKVLELQQGVTYPINEWVRQNITQYRQILEEEKRVRDTYAPNWRRVQQAFAKFGGQTNLPWCMNQRFTSPIYSLLDDWLASRQAGGMISADYLPNITTSPQQDMIIDFSTIITMTGSITIPVLEPIQIIISDIPLPPGGKDYGTLPVLPPLPSIDAIQTHMRTALDNLPHPPSNAVIPPPLDMHPLGEPGLQKLGGDIQMIEATVNTMNDRYDKFWQSIGPFTEGEESEIKQMKEARECYGWDSPTCQHVEMDLFERFVRIGSRPLVLLREDYESHGAPRGIGGHCITQDDVCTPVHGETTTAQSQWEIGNARTDDSSIEDLRSQIRGETLPAPVGGIPRDQVPPYDTDLNDLLPVHDVPAAIDLNPPRPPPAQ